MPTSKIRSSAISNRVMASTGVARTRIADERYIRDSILLPRSQVATGYQAVMPSFAGKVGEDDLVRLVAYIKSLAEEGGSAR